MSETPSRTPRGLHRALRLRAAGNVAVAALIAGICLGHTVAGETLVTVRADKSLGPVPYLFRAGSAVNVKPLGYPLEKFFTDQRPGSFYVANWNYDHYVKYGRSFRNMQSYLDDPTTGWNNNIEWMKRISDSGGEINLTLGTSYWYGDPGDGIPPRDLDDWERFVRETVNLFDNEMKLNVRYQVWDEPDTSMFRGTLDQYFEVIRRAVIGMKRANPRAKFGGPAPSDFAGRGFRAAPAERPIVYNFIKYCAQTPLPEVGLPRIPIDYVAWHVFDKEPYTSLLNDQAAQVRAWLREFGYDEKTELNINSWARWGGLSTEEFNGPFLAAYILPMLCAMDDAGISRHVYFNVFDHWLPEAAQYPDDEFFEGGYGLFTRHFIVKPVYNAFQAVSMLRGNRLAVDETDPFVTCVASSDGDTTSILISNFVPRAMAGYIVDNGQSLGEIRSFASSVRRLQWSTGRPESECAEEVLRSIGDPRTRDRLRAAGTLFQRVSGKPAAEVREVFAEFRRQTTDPQSLAELDDVTALLREADSRRSTPVRVKLNVAGFGSARAGYERFVIDAIHSNAYAVRDRIARVGEEIRRAPSREALTRAVRDINEWPEVRLSAADRGVVGAENMLTFEMQPYSVHLVVLRGRGVTSP